MNKYILGILVVIAAFAIAGGYYFPQVSKFVGSPTGSTFSTAKIASVVMAPLTGAATSTSILNTDSSARWVADFGFSGCTGAGSSFTFPNTSGTGLANFAIQAATTSVPSQGLQGNTNYALNMNVSTTSAVYTQNSTSTVPAQAGYWAPGTYMTFTFNATNTASCVIELDYVAS